MLQDFYTTTVVPKLKDRLQATNIHAIPKLEKVVLNVGVGKHLKDEAYIAAVEKTLAAISGQKPVRTKARLSISNFKLREGNIVGVKVTIRGKRMYDFIERLLRVTFPRVRDFRGISTKGFDRQGNFTIGFREQIAFPELNPDEITHTHGLEVTVVTSAKNEEGAQALLEELGFPFTKKKK